MLGGLRLKAWWLVIMNVVWLTLLVVAVRHGLLDTLSVKDPTRISFCILILFLVASGYSLIAASGRTDIELVYDTSSLMITMGLFGTIIGIILALEAVDANTIVDANAAGRTVATMISGIGVAVWTTAVGLGCGIPTWINYKTLGGRR